MRISNSMINSLIKKASSQPLLKTADDMALFEGQVDYSNRDGLVWHRFQPGQFQGPESLPPDAQEKILSMMEGFKNQFKQYATNPRTGSAFADFRGMLWVMYAHDKAVNDEAMKHVPPQLQETADFVNSTGVLLTPEGNQNDSIGAPFWISYNGHAYQNIFPDQVKKVESSRAEEIRSITNARQVQQAEENGWPYGNLVVRQSGRGFSLFLESQKGSVPLIRGQSYGAMRDYFKDKITINSDVALPEGVMGRVIPAPLKRPRKGKLDEHTQVDQGIRDQASNIRQQAINQGALYQLKADDSGTLYVVNRTSGDTHYLDQSQVQSLVSEKFLNKPLFIIPGTEADLSDFGDMKDQITKKKIGPWRMSPELINFLENSDSPYSFNHLRYLRGYLDDAYQATHGRSMHTPLEGIKIVMIGPAFTRPQTGHGVTQTSPQFATHETVAKPGIQPTDNIAVEQVTWVVIANEITKNSGLKNPWSQTSQIYDVKPGGEITTAEEAIQKAKKYVGSDSHILQETAESVRRADAALRNAVNGGVTQQPAQKPQMQPTTVQPPAGNTQAPAVPQQPQKPIQNNDLYYSGYKPSNSYAKSILDKIRKNGRS